MAFRKMSLPRAIRTCQSLAQFMQAIDIVFVRGQTPPANSSITIARAVMTPHYLHSSPETCHWGFFEAALKPVMTIASGDEVTVDTVSGGPDVLPDPARFHIPPELAAIHTN